VLTRYQAAEPADRGIRADTLSGGAVETDFGSGILHSDPVKRGSAETITPGRIATADDIGVAVLAILSNAFPCATGGNIESPVGKASEYTLTMPNAVPQARLPGTESVTGTHAPGLSVVSRVLPPPGATGLGRTPAGRASRTTAGTLAESACGSPQ
jgi:enoyl-ACP reductase-like protein